MDASQVVGICIGVALLCIVCACFAYYSGYENGRRDERLAKYEPEEKEGE